MVDHLPQTVCCMCGDVGFPDKLFRCSNCRTRFQHLYCSNSYSERSEPIGICDWCQCEGKSSSSSGKNSSSKSGHANAGGNIRQQQRREEGGSSAEKAAGKLPSPRPNPRRYKLLKDVMC
ncbi:zinc ion binding protein [Striga asiatica]|uniref:Zinc ion binding protein n=1 Tax=Striga asiatica TaxID=4170 RepID=A0A5A7QWA8_STRAF|nr:zinc ion binding protein [Striga asiatica]